MNFHHGVLHLRVTRVIEITLGFAFQCKASFGISLCTRCLFLKAFCISFSKSSARLGSLLSASPHFFVAFGFRVRALLVCESNAFVLTRATRTAGIRHSEVIRISDDAFRLSHTPL